MTRLFPTECKWLIDWFTSLDLLANAHAHWKCLDSSHKIHSLPQIYTEVRFASTLMPLSDLHILPHAVHFNPSQGTSPKMAEVYIQQCIIVTFTFKDGLLWLTQSEMSITKQWWRKLVIMSAWYYQLNEIQNTDSEHQNATFFSNIQNTIFRCTGPYYED